MNSRGVGIGHSPKYVFVPGKPVVSNGMDFQYDAVWESPMTQRIPPAEGIDGCVYASSIGRWCVQRCRGTMVFAAFLSVP
ncbi:hypothetical protein [Paenibacillus sp. PvR148]